MTSPAAATANNTAASANQPSVKPKEEVIEERKDSDVSNEGDDVNRFL